MKSALLVLVALGLTKDDAVKKALDKLQGEWVVNGAEYKGKKISEDDRKQYGGYLLIKFSITGDQLRCWIQEKDKEPKEGEATPIKLDLTKSPAKVSFGQNFELSAIYAVEGDTLKVCMDMEFLQGRDAPASFDTGKNDQAYLLVLKRAKKK